MKRLGKITLALDISDRHKKADMFNDFGFGDSTRAKTDVDVTTVSRACCGQHPSHESTIS